MGAEGAVMATTTSGRQDVSAETRRRRRCRPALVVLAVALALPAHAGALSFQQVTRQFNPGSGPNSIAVGRLNDDPFADLAGTNGGSNTVTTAIIDPSNPADTVLTDYPVGNSPDAVAIGDLDGDGHADMVVANAASNDVSILLGDGSGGFSQPSYSPVPVGAGPSAIKIADLNHDGKPEIVTANPGSDSVTVMTPISSGYSAQDFHVGSLAGSLAIADFNSDGNPDIVVANQGGNDVTVLLGDGMGGFSAGPASPYAVGLDPTSITAADLSGDGKPDLAITNTDSNNVTVLLGNGAGGFTEAPSSPFSTGGGGPSSVETGDLNGDGRADLVIANADTSNVSVLLGDGTGGFSFAAGSPFPVANGPVQAVVVDVTLDQVPDIITVSPPTDSATALINRGWPKLVPTPTALDFHDQSVNTISAPQVISVTNSGGGDASIDNVRVAGDQAADFLIAGDSCTGHVDHGATCQVSVRFAPSAYGLRTARLELRSDSPTSPDTIPLSGTSPARAPGSPPLAATPTPLHFVDQLVGTIGRPHVVTVTNSGGETLKVARVRTTGHLAGDFLVSKDTCTGAAVDPGDVCRIGLRFSPSGLGLRTAALKLRSDAFTEPVTVSLSGAGALAPRNGAAPRIAGTPMVHRKVACPRGSWSGTAPQTYTRQWLRDGKPIAGSHGVDFRIRRADQGRALRCRVTARNSVGSTSAVSPAVSVPRAASAPKTAVPAAIRWWHATLWW
jgi:VCBS repeat protein